MRSHAQAGRMFKALASPQHAVAGIDADSTQGVLEQCCPDGGQLPVGAPRIKGHTVSSVERRLGGASGASSSGCRCSAPAPSLSPAIAAALRC